MIALMVVKLVITEVQPVYNKIYLDCDDRTNGYISK